MRINHLFLVLALFLVQSTHATPIVIEKEPLQFPDGVPGRPAFLARIQARYTTPNTVIGEVQDGFFCSRRSAITWNASLFNEMNANKALWTIVRAELKEAHYPQTPSRPAADDIFDLQKKNPAPDPHEKELLQIGMLVKEVSVTACQHGPKRWTGDAYLKLFWQTLAPEQNKVVFEATTEGIAHSSSGSEASSLSELLQRAFRSATKQLLAEPGFLQAARTLPDPSFLASTTPAPDVGAATSLDPLTLEAPMPMSSRLSDHMTEARAGVATVVAERGSGSGFFISRQGYLLTNAHVVGNASFVRIKLTTGRELVGEVLRRDAARDIALIKTELGGFVPLPLRAEEVPIGEEVFALGSPLGETFNTSVTRGVLSGLREFEGQSFLQSDVAILPGNSGGPLLDSQGRVVGVTVAGLGAKGLAGMNFFIPIRDALNRLKVSTR